MHELGIRFRNDAEGEGPDFLLNSLEMIADHLEPDERFFFDTSDGDEEESGGKKCLDLFGWIVPSGKAAAFEDAWAKSGPGEAPDGFDYAVITWHAGDGGNPVPEINCQS